MNFTPVPRDPVDFKKTSPAHLLGTHLRCKHQKFNAMQSINATVEQYVGLDFSRRDER